MRNQRFTLACGVMLMLGMTGAAVAQDNATQPPSARQELQAIHHPAFDGSGTRPSDEGPATDPDAAEQVRPLLDEHHNKIQMLLDKNPTASRQAFGPQIHAISDQTHHEIHTLLDDHQKQLEQEMQRREENGEENRRPTPPAPAFPAPSPSAS